MESIEHPTIDNIQIDVLQKDNETYWQPNAICDIAIDTMKSYTPNQLKEIGRWLISEGKRIGKTYTSTGNVRTKALTP